LTQKVLAAISGGPKAIAYPGSRTQTRCHPGCDADFRSDSDCTSNQAKWLESWNWLNFLKHSLDKLYMAYPKAERKKLTGVEYHNDQHIEIKYNSTTLTGGPMINRRGKNGEQNALSTGRRNHDWPVEMRIGRAAANQRGR
jgi:hypothetical protein